MSSKDDVLRVNESREAGRATVWEDVWVRGGGRGGGGGGGGGE